MTERTLPDGEMWRLLNANQKDFDRINQFFTDLLFSVTESRMSKPGAIEPND